jgi:hypothetical protein
VGFEFSNVCVPAMRLTFLLEREDSPVTPLLQALPSPFLNVLRGIIPTLIYLLR